MDLPLILGQPAGPDPLRCYTPAEELALTTNLQAIAGAIHRGEYVGLRHDLDLLCSIHERLFGSVRDHAGRIRRRGYGSERLTFGPHRSFHRDEVEAGLDRVFTSLDRSIRSLDANPDAPEYETSAIHLAAWTHAEVIRVHPFEDGNGRSSRALMNSILVRQGLRPVAVEATKEEYIGVLNHFIKTSDILPLRDLYIRLMAEQIPNGN
ncbi:MAG: Fic family protein [Planctomycetes bacterium]|nr:Fic family protein [Planctomycetota bacterium]